MRRTALVTAFLMASVLASAQGRVVCWGDSLTAEHEGCYTSVLQQMLGDGWEVVNCGIGGETTLTMMARQGSAPMLTAHDIQIFRSKDVRYPKFIGNTDIPAFVSSYGGGTVTPLLQGSWEPGSNARVNPVSIDGHSYIIRSEAHHWYEKGWKFEYNYFLEPLEAAPATYIIPAGSVVLTSGAAELRGPDVNIFFIGQNGGFRDVQDLLAQLRLMKEFGAARRTIVVSFHVPNEAIGDIEGMKAMETALAEEFGGDFLALRAYLTESGLKDAGLTPKDEDIAAMKAGRVPPQLMTDGTHFTAAGYRLIAERLFAMIGRQ